jgi:hypothetical protein
LKLETEINMIGGIIGAAAGAAGNIFGGISKNKMLKDQMRMVNEMKRENQDWYDRRYNEDATQRADAQRILALTEESIRNRNRQAAGAAAVTGASDESAAATKAQGNQALAEAASQIAVNGAQRKDEIEQQYQKRDDALEEQARGLQGQKQSLLDIAGGAVGGAAKGFASGMGLD